MSDDTDLHADVARQIDELAIQRERPVIICDADEVIADFMTGFEAYLAHRGLYFTWREYKLNGHILRRSDDTAIENAAVGVLVGDFFTDCVDQLAPVEGAAAAIGTLSRRAQVVVLSNVPPAERARRQDWLKRHGMDVPLVANIGVKGPAVRELAARAAAPGYFIDDSPRHHESVARDAGHVWRLHFVANRRLAELIGPAPASHHRADDWATARTLIEADLTARGY